MTIFRFRKRAPVSVQPAFGVDERELWIENSSEDILQVMLEPWCTIVNVPPGQYAKLVATFEDEQDEFHIQYQACSFLGEYCPPDTEISVVEERWKKT